MNRKREPRTRLEAWAVKPLFDFQILLGVTALLLVVGLTMVLSSSTVESLLNSGSPYTRFFQQVTYTLAGLAVFVVVVRMPTALMRRGALWFLGIAFLLLVLVLIPGIGQEVYGAQAWIFIGPISFQPSEIAKVALVIWSAHMVARAAEARVQVDTFLRPILLVSVTVLAMVVLERDLGTAVTIAVIVMAVLWFGGFNIKLIASIGIGGVIAMVIFTLTVGYRSDRVRAFLDPNLDPQGLNYQATQAKYALANGGFFGEGLGQSGAKWSYLPQAYNDFIFAIIGEELGAIGALTVIGLFGCVLWVGLRIAARSSDPYLRMLSSIATVWIVFQAFINIAYVVGLVPVTGLQLPLISAGGTSMITTLLMFGLIAHAAYREPEARVSINTNPAYRRITRIFGSPRLQEKQQRPQRPQAWRSPDLERADRDRRRRPRSGGSQKADPRRRSPRRTDPRRQPQRETPRRREPRRAYRDASYQGGRGHP